MKRERYMSPEEERAEELKILEYYVGGNVFNPEHDERSIEFLNHIDCLTDGLSPRFEKLWATTYYGFIYMEIFGVDVEPLKKKARERIAAAGGATV